MWLAFMLMLMIFHHPKAKTSKHLFLLSVQESSPNKKFLL
jgi:hypothetical protein